LRNLLPKLFLKPQEETAEASPFPLVFPQFSLLRIGQRQMCCRKSRQRNAVRRTTDIIEARLAAEGD
jgi:hypothetical protein